MKLTTAVVRGLREPGKYSDGHGLFLHINKAGRRYWMFRYQRHEREHVMSFGNADLIMLGEARRLHTEARAQLARGLDPLTEREKDKSKAAPTFAEAIEEYVRMHQAGWRGDGAAEQWRKSLVLNAAPMLKKLVSDIDRDDVLAILQPIWTTKPVTATIVRSRIELVLGYAKARGWRDGPNPATWRDNLRNLLPDHRKIHTTVHRAALPWREAPAFMARLREQESVPARCLMFCILTGVRSGEARGARWDEINMEQRLWVIPARMKGGKQQHRVPLSEPAMDILKTLARLRTADGLVFFGRHGRPLAETTLRDLLRGMGHEVTVHGFRSTFRDWAADNGRAWEVAEAALAHAAPGRVVQAYQRSDLLDARRPLMAAWAGFVGGSASIVVAMPNAA